MVCRAERKAARLNFERKRGQAQFLPSLLHAPSDAITIRPERLGLGAERNIGQHLDPARNGLSGLGLPSLDLVQDVVGELFREGMGGVVFADVRNGVVEAQGFTVTLSASQRANACSPMAPDARSRTA